MPTTKDFDLAVDGLNDILRALGKLPREANAELKEESKKIAEREMVPAWRNAALYYGGPWGDRIADSVRVKKDRLPAVSIGSARKRFSGGASPTMVRYPANKGTRGRAGDNAAPFGEGTDWMEKVRDYKMDAFRMWSDAVERVVDKWVRM